MNTENGLRLVEELGKIQAIDLNACTPEEVRLARGRWRAFLNIGQASKAPSEKVLQGWERAKESLEEVQHVCGRVVKSIVEEHQRIEAGETNGAIQVKEGKKLSGGGITNGSFLIFGATITTCHLPTAGNGMEWNFDLQKGLYLPRRITVQDGLDRFQLQVQGGRWILVDHFPNGKAPGEWLDEADLEGITSLHGSGASVFRPLPFVTEELQTAHT